VGYVNDAGCTIEDGIEKKGQMGTPVYT